MQEFGAESGAEHALVGLGTTGEASVFDFFGLLCNGLSGGGRLCQLLGLFGLLTACAFVECIGGAADVARVGNFLTGGAPD